MRVLHEMAFGICAQHKTVLYKGEWSRYVEGFNEFLDSLTSERRVLIAEVYCPYCEQDDEDRASA